MLNRPHMYLGVLEDANVLLPRENGRGWLKCRAGAVIQHSCVLWRLTIRNILTSTYDFQRSRQCSRMPVCTHVHVDHTSIQNPVHLFVGCHQSSVPPLYRMVCHIFCSFFLLSSPFPQAKTPPVHPAASRTSCYQLQHRRSMLCLAILQHFTTLAGKRKPNISIYSTVVSLFFPFLLPTPRCLSTAVCALIRGPWDVRVLHLLQAHMMPIPMLSFSFLSFTLKP